MNPIVAKIEEARKRKGITKTHVAKHCGHTVAWYHDISKGRRRVYLDDVFLIAESIGEDLQNFFPLRVSVTHNPSEKSA